MADIAPKDGASDTLTNDHWVSRGYQNNFANEAKRVAVVNVATRHVADPGRPTKSNFCEEGFTTYLADGERIEALERAFASVERQALNKIRELSATNRGPDLRAAVANVAAVHLVRSPSYKSFHDLIADDVRDSDVATIATDPKLPPVFERDFGRAPDKGELLAIAHEQFEQVRSRPETVRHHMARQHDLMADKLNTFHMQLVEVAPELHGFALGDTPIVHADPSTGRYGFRDRLALLDSSVVFLPITRRKAVFFCVRPLSPFTVKTRTVLDRLNALTIRAAAIEVACHPDDADRIRQTCQRIDRLNPSALF